MTHFTQKEYRDEIDAITQKLIVSAVNKYPNDHAMAYDCLFDYMLDDAIEEHNWHTEKKHHLDVIKFSNNINYSSENFKNENLIDDLKKEGLPKLLKTVAYWCMHADTANEIEEAMYERKAINDRDNMERSS